MTDLISILAVPFVVGFIVLVYRKKCRIAAVFPPYRINDPELKRLNSSLIEISQSGGQFTFSAERYFLKTICNRSFWICYGPVGFACASSGGLHWGQNRIVFSLSDASSIDCVLGLPELFTTMVSNDTYVVCRVNLKMLVEQGATANA